MIHAGSRSSLSVLRLVLAALAVAGQILIGAIVPAVAAAADGPALLGLPDVICHAPDETPQPTQGSPRHHGADCALCPLCCTLAPVMAAFAAPPVLPTPAITRVDTNRAPAASAGPPAVARGVPPPRGPPALI